jgi:hypothetical protein
MTVRHACVPHFRAAVDFEWSLADLERFIEDKNTSFVDFGCRSQPIFYPLGCDEIRRP